MTRVGTCRGATPILAAVALTALVSSACGPSRQARRYSRAQAQKSLLRLEKPGLVLGEFPLAGDAVLDGDTIRVDGLQSTLRLLAIDCEEIYHHEKNHRAAEADFEQYLEDRRSGHKRPVKTGTPMGVEARKFAENFLAGVDTVRLERDNPKDIRGHYGRYLAYVMVKKNGKWFNYNVEAVRAGMSPYFSKYGYSRRFHQQFVEAEKEARAAKRGVWDPTKKHYRDYAERKAWWDARGEFVRQFEHDAQGKDNYIELTNWDAMAKLEAYKDRQVTVLATVGDVVLGDRGPTRVNLSRRMFGDLPVIFWDKDVFLATGLADYRGEFVRVTGTVAEYTFKKSGKKILQIVVDRASNVMLSPVPGLEDVRASLPSAPPPPTPEQEAAIKARGAAPVPEPTQSEGELPVFGPESEY